MQERCVAVVVVDRPAVRLKQQRRADDEQNERHEHEEEDREQKHQERNTHTVIYADLRPKAIPEARLTHHSPLRILFTL